jgi:hypothetical protein
MKLIYGIKVWASCRSCGVWCAWMVRFAYNLMQSFCLFEIYLSWDCELILACCLESSQCSSKYVVVVYSFITTSRWSIWCSRQMILSPSEVDNFVANNKPIMQLKSSPRRSFPRRNPFVVTSTVDKTLQTWSCHCHSICCYINGRKVCDDGECDERWGEANERKDEAVIDTSSSYLQARIISTSYFCVPNIEGNSVVVESMKE